MGKGTSPSTKRVAIVGTGVSGLFAAWLLSKSDPTVHITLIEREDDVGGHVLTHGPTPECAAAVDLGFQVFNLSTYPLFERWLDELGVDSEPSDMSFSISVRHRLSGATKGEDDTKRTEWGSRLGLSSVFAQPMNALSPTFLGMLSEALRFGHEAHEVLGGECAGSEEEDIWA